MMDIEDIRESYEKNKWKEARHLQVYLNQRHVVRDRTFFTYRGEAGAKTIHR